MQKGVKDRALFINIYLDATFFEKPIDKKTFLWYNSLVVWTSVSEPLAASAA